MIKPGFSKKKLLRPIRGRQSPISDDLISKFLTHVRSTPDKVAIMTTETSLTYKELYNEVVYWKTLFNQHLHTPIILCLERTPRMLAVLLALQWLEITYIPVDTSTPIERLRTIVDDSQAQALLYDSTKHPDYSDLACLQFDLSNIEQSLPITAKINKTQLIKKNTIAYIIYTSGSTGQPKGVAISRRALNNFLISMSSYFLNKEDDTLLAITTLAFDIAALELYLPLWQNKRVFLANQEQHKDPFHIKTILTNYPITLLQATPSMWKMLESVEWTGQADLVALCGGEPLTQTLAQSLLAKVADLWNMYGPTEATIWCSLKQIKQNEPITIGRPIDNTEMRVMDSSHKILPPYVKGELFIGGLSLAEGYINNSALTQTRFIPCKDALGGRLYRVGDLACTTENGEFIIFGRSDNQIKLHGYRIELEDIEARIQTFRGIQQCAVNVYQEQLIAYLCLAQPTDFSEIDLRNHLALYLPDYMIPNRIILLDQLPLSTSGKIDRKALSPPSSSASIHSNSELTELTVIHLSLIRIWAEELGVRTLGIHDNFFELGGHSLLAARIILKISQQMGKQIALNDFYYAPTIARFADVVEQTPIKTEAEIVKRKRRFTKGRWLPLNDFQLLLWISWIFAPDLKKFNIVARRRVQGPLNKRALDLALQLVFQKHEILSYTINRFYPAQKRQTKWSLQWIETSLFNDDEKVCESYLSKSFNDLFCHQLWRHDAPMVLAKLFYLRHDQIELQISMSHLISDENSIAIFFQDLSNAYLFYAQHTTLNARESFQSFNNYVLKQNDLYTQYENVDASFWRQYLQDARLFSFPEKYIVRNPKKQQFPFSTYLEIPEELLAKLRRFSAQNQVTLSDVLCAAISLSLLICCENEFSLSHKLFVNTVKSAREDSHFDNIIGCFLRIHPIKLDLSKGTTLVSLSKQAQRSAIETTEYQRASSLVKLASIGQLSEHKKSLPKFLLSLGINLFSKISQYIKLNNSVLRACLTLASMEHKNNFFININIQSSFFSENSTTEQTLFGVQPQTIPPQPYTVSPVEYVFDVSFLRDSYQNIPFIVISSNLIPAFRERFAKTLLEIIEQEN